MNNKIIIPTTIIGVTILLIGIIEAKAHVGHKEKFFPVHPSSCHCNWSGKARNAGSIGTS